MLLKPDNPGGMGEATSPALTLPGSTLPCWLTKEQSQFSLTPSEPAHLCPCIQAGCGPFSLVLQLARSRANAPISCPQGHLSHTTPTKGGASPPTPMPPGPARLCCRGKGWGQLWATLRHRHGPRQQPRSGTSTWPLVVAWAMDMTQTRHLLLQGHGPRHGPWR